MKKNTISVFVALLCAGSILAGCGGSGDAPETTASTTEVTVTEAATETSAPAETTAPATTETTAPATTAPATETSAPAPETSAPAAETTAPAESAAASTGKYVDLDNMQFSINGKTYTLGQTTLQQLIDDGVPFNEDDLANAGNNLSKNSESQGFRIELAEYWSAQVYVLNDTDGNKTTSECYISKVYLPFKKDATQDILTFAFPLDITMDDLKANAGEPTDSSHYDGDDGYFSDKLEYTRDSSKYIGDYGYSFEFTKGKLQYITIDYMP